jgi:DNA-binding transcriptional regulator YdaS (Cro superfamily)
LDILTPAWPAADVLINSLEKIFGTRPIENASELFLMIRVGALLMALMITSATAGKVDVNYCAQASDVTAARLRSAFALQQNTTLQKDDSCRVYRREFYAAAVTRQNITHCEQDDIRQRALQVIDAEIDAFNDLIANSCGE